MLGEEWKCKRTGKLVMGEDIVREAWKKYFQDLNKVNREHMVTYNMYGFGGARREEVIF